MTNATKYGSLRVKRETMELLKNLREAFEISYETKLSIDEFIRQMAASVEDGAPAVWEIYCARKAQMEELKGKIEASRRIHEKKK